MKVRVQIRSHTKALKNSDFIKIFLRLNIIGAEIAEKIIKR